MLDLGHTCILPNSIRLTITATGGKHRIHSMPIWRADADNLVLRLFRLRHFFQLTQPFTPVHLLVYTHLFLPGLGKCADGRV